MVLSEAIEEYRAYARNELGHSPNTCYCYTSWHRHFALWLGEQGHPDPLVHQINAGLIRRFSYSLTSRQLRPRTVRGALHAIRALFAYLAQMGAIKANPASEVRLPKKDAAQRLLVNDEDLAKLLDAAARQRDPFRSVRDRAVLAVLIYGALRRAELLNVHVSDLDLQERALLIREGKGQRSRTVFLCDDAAEALRECVSLRAQGRYDHPYLFIAHGRRRLGEASLSHLVEDVKAIAGFKGDPRIKPHSIRHAAATRLLRNGADLRSIQTWLGHTQLQTTAVYLHTDEEQVRKIAPLAGFRAPEPPPVPASDAARRAAFHRQRGRGS